MKTVTSKFPKFAGLALGAALALSCLAAGCSNEPDPAQRAVAAANRADQSAARAETAANKAQQGAADAQAAANRVTQAASDAKAAADRAEAVVNKVMAEGVHHRRHHHPMR